MRAGADATPLRLGEGRISGLLGVFLGVLCVLAVLCFHYPQWLTTPELRAAYPVESLRWLLLAGMLLAALLGALSLLLSPSKRLGFAGIALALVAEWMGGPHVEVDAFDSPVVSFGFDWLVLALLANSLVFVFIEKVWPLRPEQPTLRREWRLDLAYYAFNHVMVGVVLLATTFFSETLFGWAVHDGLQALVRSSNTRLRFGWLEQLFVSPHFHHWHHAADAEAIDRNYAANLPILDRLFGTYASPHERWPERYGVVGKPLPQGFFGQLLYPFMARRRMR